ncbi:MAG: hypothetical protein K2X02_01975 [Alphaproteobacteria bacterium]|nr:hypothetical protein [Alphaproteobacteria bacterium]
MNILKKLKLVLLMIGAMLSSYAVYAIEETEEKKPVSGVKPSSKDQKVPSSKPIGPAKAALLKAHKFPTTSFTKRPAARD